MEAIDKELLNEITDAHEYEGAYNIRMVINYITGGL